MVDIGNEQGKRKARIRWSQPGWRGQRTGGWSPGKGAGRGSDREWGGYHGFGWHRGHGSGGPGFRGGRKAGRGDVRAAIIALLAEEPMHGYQIMGEITERSGGVWRPSPGSVYPTLQALEDAGLVTATTTDGRRVYQLTEEGRSVAETIGNEPAPWELASRHDDRSLRELGGLVGDVAQAMAQAVRTGTPAQVDEVRDILADTRRRIYLVLAEGPATAEPAGDVDD